MNTAKRTIITFILSTLLGCATATSKPRDDGLTKFGYEERVLGDGQLTCHV